MTAPKMCKDCAAEEVATVRPAPHPGPRCATHHRARRKEVQAANHDRSVQRTYGLAPGEYAALLAWQDGVCAGCGPRTGRNGTRGRRLAVDHDHGTGEVRGLLCATCNQQVGEQRDDAMTFQRLALYLWNPPMRSMRASQWPPVEGPP